VKAILRLLLLLFFAVGGGCQREERSYRSDPIATESEERIALVSLSVGPSGPQTRISGKGKEFESNAYHVSQGKTLYRWFNCNGCHANGGGGSGPPLMDDTWIYGGSIEDIVHTIREGRPNGMPSFRGKVPEDQIWQVAAYVRSLSGNIAKDVAPSRNDSMHPGPSENRTPAFPPVTGGTSPPSGQMPQ
jgi:cytochrome c oxidase cbb3-type subunit III